MSHIQLVVIQGSKGHLSPMTLMVKTHSAMSNAYEVKGKRFRQSLAKFLRIETFFFFKELHFQNDNIGPWQTKSPVKLIKSIFKK